MSKILVFLVLFLLIGCKISNNDTGKSSNVRSGEFSIHSSEISGDGTIEYREIESENAITEQVISLYTPFGSKFLELRKRFDSISVDGADSNPQKVSIFDSASSLFSSSIVGSEFTCGDLFDLMAGQAPVTWFVDTSIINSGFLSISRMNGCATDIVYTTPIFSCSLSDLDMTTFRAINLSDGRKNYFKISYE